MASSSRFDLRSSSCERSLNLSEHLLVFIWGFLSTTRRLPINAINEEHLPTSSRSNPFEPLLLLLLLLIILLLLLLLLLLALRGKNGSNFNGWNFFCWPKLLIPSNLLRWFCPCGSTKVGFLLPGCVGDFLPGSVGDFPVNFFNPLTSLCLIVLLGFCWAAMYSRTSNELLVVNFVLRWRFGCRDSTPVWRSGNESIFYMQLILIWLMLYLTKCSRDESIFNGYPGRDHR